jgi:hypothetical protein
MRSKKIAFLFCCVLSMAAISCKKYLEEKPAASLVVPSSLPDLQALLDYFPKMNTNDAGCGDAAADDYYLAHNDWLALSEPLRRTYTWEKEGLFDASTNDWSRAYERVYFANTVLEAVEKMGVHAPGTAAGNIKGQALLARARSFLQAVIIWSVAYDNNTAATDLGIPLRLTTDFNQPSVRSSVLQTYRQIIDDLQQALILLPVTPLHKMRPSRPAAYALLARTFLAMRQYGQAGLYADSCLQLYNSLIDFNSLNASATFPFSQFNAEVIFHSTMTTPASINNSRAKIDSLLYRSYAANDLRKLLYFRNNNNGSFAFKGSYDGTGLPFTGISVAEAYLTRAEASAREGKTSAAMNDLNTLLLKRWKTGTFVPFTAATAGQAVTLVLQERRKELLFRGTRWMDIKRLNREPGAIVLVRNLNGTFFSLQPNSPRYALPIPDDIIDLSGMQQNPR